MIRIYGKLVCGPRLGHATVIIMPIKKIVTNPDDFGKADRRQHLPQLNEEPKNVEI